MISDHMKTLYGFSKSWVRIYVRQVHIHMIARPSSYTHNEYEKTLIYYPVTGI